MDQPTDQSQGTRPVSTRVRPVHRDIERILPSPNPAQVDPSMSRLGCDEAPLPIPDPPEHHFGQEHPMTPPVGGIDPHQDTFTVGIVDRHGVEITHETFDNTAAGYGAAIDLLDAYDVRQVGVEGSAKWGAHVAIALAAAGFDAREVPASRSAAQRRSRRLDKTDAVDAVASARALLAADAGTGAGSGGPRPRRRGDRGGARTPQNPCGCSHFDAPPRRGPDLQAAHRDTRPAHHEWQDRSPAVPPRNDRP